MIDTIEVTINGKKYTYSKDVTLQEIYREHQSSCEHPVLLARIDNRLRELSMKIDHDCTVEFLDLSSIEGNRAHINGLVFVMIYAVQKLFGKKSNVIVQHSIDKGLYLETNFKLTEEKTKLIKKAMQEIIKQDLPIKKLNIDRYDAIKYFNEVGDPSKAGILRYNTDNYITLYRLGNVYNYFYNLLPPSTGKVKEFDLTFISDKGLVLQFPTVHHPETIKKYKDHPQMFQAFREHKTWAKLIGLTNCVDLNRVVSTGKIDDLIKIEETVQNGILLKLSQDINDHRDKVKIVLMAGPSSSGKTTTSRKLRMFLEIFGLHPKAISMDDYFHDKKKTPKDENGEYDYECLEAVDLELFDKQMAALLKGEEVTLPTFNFLIGEKEFRNKMKLEDQDIIIVEGIHALDPKILSNISRDKKYKIYVSPLTELNMDDHNRISTTDNRLLRRIVRDNRTRNYNVEHTLEQWAKVRDGEEKYIFPYQDEADNVINSAVVYEIGILKTYAEPLLYSVENNSPYYEEAKRLLNILKLFLPIPADAIPEDAVLREFIGGSYFHD